VYSVAYKKLTVCANTNKYCTVHSNCNMKDVGWRLEITELRTPCEKFLAAPLESYLCIQSAFHMRISYWPKLKSAAQIFGIICHKFLPVTWPRPRPLWGKLLASPLGFSKRMLCTKYEDSSWSNSEDMFDCMPKSLRVTWPRPRPLWGKLFERPLGFPQTKRFTKFVVSNSSSFEDMFDCMPKIEGSRHPRDLGRAPFG